MDNDYFLEKLRYKTSLDTVSILETDSACDPDESDLHFQDMLRLLEDDRERFVCTMYAFNYQGSEIAWIMGIHRSTVFRIYRRALNKIRKKMQQVGVNKG